MYKLVSIMQKKKCRNKSICAELYLAHFQFYLPALTHICHFSLFLCEDVGFMLNAFTLSMLLGKLKHGKSKAALSFMNAALYSIP